MTSLEMDASYAICDPLRRAARRLCRAAVCRALAYVFIAVVFAVFVTAVIDRAMQTQSLAGRWVLSFVVWVPCLAGLLIVGRTWVRFRHRERDLAAWIEHHHPTLRGWLVNSLAFLAEPAPPDADRTASRQLRTAVIQESARRISEFDVNRCVQVQPARMACLTAIVVLVVISALVAMFPHVSWISLQRLAAPWAAIELPRRHVLHVENPPERVARGTDIQFRVVGRSLEMPDDVFILYRWEGPAAPATVRRRMDPSDGTFVDMLAQVQQSFSFRAVGGDDRSMPWRRISVVDPPQVIRCQVQLQPPEYTRRRPSVEPGSFTAVEGSRVTVSVHLDQPVRQAEFFVRDAMGRTSYPVDITHPGDHLEAPQTGSTWLPRRSGDFWLALQDRAGTWFDAAVKWSFIVQEDRPPAIDWLRPISGFIVTPQSHLSIKGRCSDDFGIAAVTLKLRRPADDAAAVRPSLDTSHDIPLHRSSVDQPRSTSFDCQIKLADLADLQPNTRIALCVMVTDVAGKSRETNWRDIRVIAGDEMLTRFQARFAAIVGQLRDARRRQRDLIKQGSLAGQSDIHRQLVHGKAAALSSLRRLIDDLDHSGLPVTHLRDPVFHTVSRLMVLRDDTIGPLDSLLRNIGEAPAAGLMRRAAVYQQRIADSLSDALALSDHWERLSQLLQHLEETCVLQLKTASQTRVELEASLTSADAIMDDRPHELAAEQRNISRRLATWRRGASDWISGAADFTKDAISAAGLPRLVTCVRDLERGAWEFKSGDAANRLARGQWSLAYQRQRLLLREFRRYQQLLSGGGASGEKNGNALATSSEPQESGDEAATEGGPADDSVSASSDAAGTDGGAAGASSAAADDQPLLDSLTLDEWGQLPPRIRENFIRGVNEDFLPGYEQVIRDYYRRLAEP